METHNDFDVAANDYNTAVGQLSQRESSSDEYKPPARVIVEVGNSGHNANIRGDTENVSVSNSNAGNDPSTYNGSNVSNPISSAGARRNKGISMQSWLQKSNPNSKLPTNITSINEKETPTDKKTVPGKKYKHKVN